MWSFWQKIKESRQYRQWRVWWRKIKIMRRQVPLFRVWEVLYQKLTETNIHQQASAIAFSFTLSLFPAILFLFSLIPYIAYYLQIPDLTTQILGLLREAIPVGIYEFVAPTIQDIIEHPRGDLLSVVFILALYASTSAVVELMYTFNQNYQYSEKRSFILRRLIAFWLAFVFAFLLVFVVVVMLAGQLALHLLLEYKILDPDLTYYSLVALRYVITFLVFYVAIAYIYYAGPASHKDWHFWSYGAGVASLFAILSTNAFSYYLSHFATYNKLYGSIGTLIALMVWFYLLAWILLLGFTLDSSMLEAKIDYKRENEDKYNLLSEL
jgi:membrane protein